MNLGVQCFDTTVKKLRETSEIGDLSDGDTQLSDELGGSTSRKDFDIVLVQTFCKVFETCLVRDRDECAGNAHKYSLSQHYHLRELTQGEIDEREIQ